MIRVLIETYTQKSSVDALPWHRVTHERMEGAARTLTGGNITMLKQLITQRAHERIEACVREILHPVLTLAHHAGKPESSTEAPTEETEKMVSSVHALTNPETYWGRYVKQRILEAFSSKYGPETYGLCILFRRFTLDRQRTDAVLTSNASWDTCLVPALTDLADCMLHFVPDDEKDACAHTNPTTPMSLPTQHKTDFSIKDFIRRLELQAPNIASDSNTAVHTFSVHLLKDGDGL